MSRDYLLFLEDMQTSCEKILRYTEDIGFDQFAADEKTYDAAIFNLVILGEATKNIPSGVRERLSKSTVAQESGPERYLSPQILRTR